jgi:predicted RNA-binding protein with PIN domain
LLRAAADSDKTDQARSRVVELERELRRLTAKLDRVTADLHALRSTAQRPVEPAGESERLRLRLREQGSRIRELQQQVETGAAQAAEGIAVANAERDSARAEVAIWRQRAESATVRAESASASLLRMRESTENRRAGSDRRLELLLETLEGAASGLRREWSLVHGGPSPADVVAAGLPRLAADAERTADPSRLTSWAGLPGAHLIVDGYNVTKTGYPELSLSDQRDRLIRSLAALAARTSAEVTVVFDGAAVATARPPGRGIRVLFSAAGVIADHVIRDLVRAEPAGRVVIVVSSDREVAETAARDGARTAPSAALLAAVSS